MAFALDPGTSAVATGPAIGSSVLGRWEHDTGDGVRLSVSSGPCAEPVLARVIGIIASEADFVFDRLSDAQLLGGAIAERAADHATNGRIAVGLRPGEHELELMLGPLVPGGGRALMQEAQVPGFGPLVERLADEVEVEERDPGEEFLRARLGAGLG
jgi:serine/threonine-protein kinase RsbW